MGLIAQFWSIGYEKCKLNILFVGYLEEENVFLEKFRATTLSISFDFYECSYQLTIQLINWSDFL